MKSAWLLPSFLEGSGGHRTMFQNLQILADNGFVVDVYVERSNDIFNETELKNQVKKYFGKYNCNLILGWENIKTDYDIVFATIWYSAKVIRDLQSNAKKVYFIQDFEAFFNPMGDGYLMALNSYEYGLYPITIGRWLSSKMENEYKNPSQWFDFCADKNVYKPLNIKRENAICFVYQPDKPRRCSNIGIESLGIVKHYRPDVKIYLYGSKEKGNVWFEHENLGIISLEKCNELYNKCSVGLCISSSNPSRIPFEMMATGLPVVDLYMENNLYDMPSDGVLLAHYTPESIAEAIIKLLDNKELRLKMSNSGINYMKNKSLEDGYKQFYKAVQNILNGTKFDFHSIECSYKNEPVVASKNFDVIFNNCQRLESENPKTFIQKLKAMKIFRESRLAHKIYRFLKKFR